MRATGPAETPARGAAFVERIDRKAQIRAFLLLRLVRAHRQDFERNGRVAAIVGDYIADRIRIYGRYENADLNALDALVLPHVAPGSDCVDVGANIGNHSLFFSRRFTRVIAFEPNPVARNLLELNLRMNGVGNVKVRPEGLSDAEGATGLSFTPDNLGGARRGDADDNADEVEIALTTGDAALDPERPVGFVKIDVEGMEPEVLRGLERTLERWRPVIMAEELAASVDAASGKTEVFEILAGRGYRPHEIRRIRRARPKVLNDLLTLISGAHRYVLTPVERFEPRDHPVVIYLPEEIARRVLQAN